MQCLDFELVAMKEKVLRSKWEASSFPGVSVTKNNVYVTISSNILLILLLICNSTPYTLIIGRIAGAICKLFFLLYSKYTLRLYYTYNVHLKVWCQNPCNESSIEWAECIFGNNAWRYKRPNFIKAVFQFLSKD